VETGEIGIDLSRQSAQIGNKIVKSTDEFIREISLGVFDFFRTWKGLDFAKEDGSREIQLVGARTWGMRILFHWRYSVEGRRGDSAEGLDQGHGG